MHDQWVWCVMAMKQAGTDARAPREAPLPTGVPIDEAVPYETGSGDLSDERR